MAEEKEKAENLRVELKPEDRKLLQGVRSAIENIGKSSTTPNSESTEKPAEAHEHWKADDLLASECPDCQKELEKIGKQYMKQTLTERKDIEAYPEVCVECGTPVTREEGECPTCGGKHSRSR